MHCVEPPLMLQQFTYSRILGAYIKCRLQSGRLLRSDGLRDSMHRTFANQ